MTTPTILICLTPSGAPHITVSGDNIHWCDYAGRACAAAVRLAGRDHERIRAYVEEAVGVRPTVTEEA